MPPPATVDDLQVTFDNTPTSAVEVLASGHFGGEVLELSIDGVVVASWVLASDPDFYGTPNYQTLTYTHPTLITNQDVRVAFVNDGGFGAVDRNVLVDAITIDGVRYESEDPGVYASGFYQSGEGCVEGFLMVELLVCAGYFDYPVDNSDPSTEPSVIEVIAMGHYGGEIIKLSIDDVDVDDWELAGDAASFYSTTAPAYETLTYTHTGPITDEDIKVHFINNGPTPLGQDRDVRIDAIVVDGVRYDSEHIDVYGTGVYKEGVVACDAGGNFEFEFLHCNGYFDYPVDNPPPGPGTALRVGYVEIDGVQYPATDTAVGKLGSSEAGCETVVFTPIDVLDCPGWFDYSGVTDTSTTPDPATTPGIGTATVTYTYDPASGRTTSITYPDGGTRSFGYDNAGRLETDLAADADGALTASLSYGWDCENSLIYEVVNLPDNTDSGEHTYSYDRAGRLTSWNPAGTTTGQNTCGEQTPSGETYTYDNRGNRLTAGAESFTYDNRNRLTSDSDGTYTWTPSGAMDTFTPSNGDPVETYHHDAAHRLTGADQATASVAYTYDTLDRIATRNTDPFTYTGTAIDPTSDGTDLYARKPSGGLLAIETTGGYQFPLTDTHHDVIGLLEADGSLVGTAVYDPYGEPSTQTGITSRLGFQSDWTDPDTDHVWMGARWYQPSSATFLTRDTYQGELHTPFSLNRYTYANNNPNTYWDPTGHSNACTRIQGYNRCATKKPGKSVGKVAKEASPAKTVGSAKVAKPSAPVKPAVSKAQAIPGAASGGGGTPKKNVAKVAPASIEKNINVLRNNDSSNSWREPSIPTSSIRMIQYGAGCPRTYIDPFNDGVGMSMEDCLQGRDSTGRLTPEELERRIIEASRMWRELVEREGSICWRPGWREDPIIGRGGIVNAYCQPEYDSPTMFITPIPEYNPEIKTGWPWQWPKTPEEELEGLYGPGILINKSEGEGVGGEGESTQGEDDEEEDDSSQRTPPSVGEVAVGGLKTINPKRVERFTGLNPEEIKKEYLGDAAPISRYDVKRDPGSGYLIIVVKSTQQIIEVTDYWMVTG